MLTGTKDSSRVLNFVMYAAAIIFIASKSSLALADSASVKPPVVTAQQVSAGIDTTKCIQPASDYNDMNLHNASGSEEYLYQDYSPGQCPADYAMVSFDESRRITGIYNSGTYLVQRSIGSKISYSCCPLVTKWKGVEEA